MLLLNKNNDENGIIWPKSVTPFDLHLITINPKKDEQLELGINCIKNYNNNMMYFMTIVDRAGVKFNDADLIGLPIRIVVGKMLVRVSLKLKYVKLVKAKKFILTI